MVYERCINPGEYKYRPVNTKNPFPSAVDNTNIAPNYKSGDRIIGSNWKGKEHYITETDTEKPIKYKILFYSKSFDSAKAFISEYSQQGYDMSLVSLKLTAFKDVI